MSDVFMKILVWGLILAFALSVRRLHAAGKLKLRPFGGVRWSFILESDGGDGGDGGGGD